MLAWLSERGGVLTAQDLAAYDALARAPVDVAYRGRRVLTNPPPSAGGVLIAAALAELEGGATDAVRLVDVMEQVQAGRTEAFVAGLDEPGFAERFLAGRLGNTTHSVRVDGDGRACAVTCTNGEGCGLVVPGTGIHPNNIMGEEDLNPLGFHAFPPQRRMPSMMAPTVVLAAGAAGVELVLGSAGSNRIRSAILQTVIGVVDRGLDAPGAVDAPRLHFEDGVVYAEPGVDLDALRAAGRTVAPFRDRNLFFGGVQAVLRDAGTGRAVGRRGPPPRRRRGARVRRPAATALAVVAALGLAACGTPSADLFVVRRSGTIPGAELSLRVTDGGQVSCDGGDLKDISSKQLIDARAILEGLQGKKDEKGPADRNLRLPPQPGSTLSYRVRSEDGTVVFSDTSRGQPQVFYELAKLTRDIARGVCGRPR